jgi:hypothetical protein
MVSINNYKNNTTPTWKAFIVVFIIKFGGPNIKPLASGVLNRDIITIFLDTFCSLSKETS